jgi:hypothetical protein
MYIFSTSPINFHSKPWRKREIPTSSRKKYLMHYIFLQDRKEDIDYLEGVFKS